VEQLLFQLERPSAVDAAGTKITRGLAGELGALVADEVLGLGVPGRQIGKALVEGKQKRSGLVATQQIAFLRDEIVSAVLEFVKTISTPIKSRSSKQNITAKLAKAQNLRQANH
jgi:hypothetical protein